MINQRNPVGWFEIYVDDLDRAKAFYETVFQVKLEPLPNPVEGPEMLAFPGSPEKAGVAGALCKLDGCGPGAGGTLVYFSCDDCAVEESRVVAAGGTVQQSKFSIGEYGYIAMVADPEGNAFGLHNPAADASC